MQYPRYAAERLANDPAALVMDRVGDCIDNTITLPSYPPTRLAAHQG